ncbi:MAG: alpha/beta fold hydrolase [Alphaproteobacteria bacterium]|nr:alpha/beta fold hydrolase [Alphaproteobacteria bacterium]
MNAPVNAPGTAGLRSGPRPLPLVLAAAGGMWTSSLAALPLARHGLLPWNPALAAASTALKSDLEQAAVAPLGEAVATEVRRRLDEFLQGVEAYRAHPYRRRVPEPPVLWRDGTTRVLDYGAGRNSGTPILVVPSLVNRGYILDLTEERSLMRGLASLGLAPYLVDWGVPGPAEASFGVGDYVTQRLAPALDEVVAVTGRPVAVVGYCMGGLLALALALRRPESVAALAFLATPWDFHAELGTGGRSLLATVATLDAPLVGAAGLPVDAIQAFFFAADPLAVIEKYRRFAALPPRSARARAFVAVEDWVNDGVPLTPRVTEECFCGWYGENQPASGTWRVAGRKVDPARWQKPALVVVPARDRIVPPASAAALARAMPGAARLGTPLGHIGMVVADAAPRLLWRPLAAWLGAAAAASDGRRRGARLKKRRR